MNRFLKTSCLALVLTALGLSSAWAHKGSDAYLSVQEVATAPAPSAGVITPLRNYQLTLAVALSLLRSYQSFAIARSQTLQAE